MAHNGSLWLDEVLGRSGDSEAHHTGRGVCGQGEQSGLDSLIINSLSSDLSAHRRTLSPRLIDQSPCECGKLSDGE